MKLELTENDVLLLKLACSALIAFLIIRFLLMPGISRLQENMIQSGTLDETISTMEAAIDSIPTLEAAAESRLSQLAEVSKPYYERMENREVDELLTGLALKHGLFPVSLSIDGAKAAIPEPYLYGQTSESAEAGSTDTGLADADYGASSDTDLADTDLEGAGSTDTGLTGAGTASAVSENYILTAVGHMVLQGDESKLFALLDDVEDNYPALKLRFLRRDENLYFDADWNLVEQPDMSCDLAVYMYDLSSLEAGR